MWLQYSSLVVAALFLNEAYSTALPYERVSSTTPKLQQRMEWRKMTASAKASYINAVKCTQQRPAPSSLQGAKTLFDYFTAVHKTLATDPKLGDTIHFVGQFLPWHRYFLHVHETYLRQCGYTGAQPYWDWTLDSGKMLLSPVFDAKTGFGGQGVVPNKPAYPYNETIGYEPPTSVSGWRKPTGACVATGPFKDYTLNVGPGNYTTPHCLTRYITDSQANASTQANMNLCLAYNNYVDFWLCNDMGVGLPDNRNGAHGVGHFTVNEEMQNIVSSPNDPLFFLHHAQLDRFWWQWQQKAVHRVFEINGRTVFPQPNTKNVTLDYVLTMEKLAGNVLIRDVMNATAMGYEYV